MTWLPKVIMPEELTSRWTSTQLVAARTPGAGPAGGGPAGEAPACRSRAISTADSRDGTVLIRHPPMDRCTVVVSIQNLTSCPIRLVPSQNCCGPMAMFPDAGTTRSISMASGHCTGSAITGRSGVLSAGTLTGSRSAGAHSSSPSSTGLERNLSAGQAMSRD